LIFERANDSMTNPRTVHVVDDDDILRELATALLDDAGYETIAYDSGSAFLVEIDAAAPGCVLLDIHMPGLDGLSVQQAMKDRGFGWPVIVLTGRGDVGLAVQAMKNGAFEFLQKPYEPEALKAVLADAFEKFEAESEEAARVSNARTLIDSLSGRELQVLRGLLAGLPNKLIAYELDLSVRTVEIYRGKVMDKLGVRGLSTAIRMALAAGVEPLEEKAR
jgi:two-component system response regulator FixJ